MSYTGKTSGTTKYLREDGALATPSGPGGASAWGDITGTLSNQTDLQTALNGKAASSHGHGISDVTGLQTALDGKQASGSYAAATHGHIIGDVTGLQTALDGKLATTATRYSVTVSAANAATTTDAQTLYFGGTFAVAPSTTAGNHRVYIPKAGTIKAAYIWAHAATAGTGESWTLAIRLNNTTDTTVQALASTANYRVWSNTGLSISVAAGNYIEIKSTNPTWATNPANVRFGGEIYIE